MPKENLISRSSDDVILLSTTCLHFSTVRDGVSSFIPKLIRIYDSNANMASLPYCSCGGVASNLHYATECLLTESWHLKIPEPQLENLWFQRVASNQLSRKKIFNIIRLIHANGQLFTPD
ncbi:hypothetical protein AVEN_55545-1 [Araneus ventricosus]|uniref:Uncharacterized protein n=1 Tax=Araneus ventricosus TaxID=182803 RepID=A0A4Y2C9P1_ARAVE|nr:hypothetical protein AVEN_55545-1 [Araneus ventricosus]